MKKMKLVLILAVVLSVLPLMAEDVPAQGKEFTMAANVNPLGIVSGSYGGNFEYLFAQMHGVVVEGAYSSSASGETSSTGYLGALHYRWHWSGAMQSGFLGAFVKYGSSTGTGTYGVGTPFTFDMTLVSYGLNVGKRWVWDNGINVVARIGYGQTSLDFETSDAGANDSIDTFKTALELLAGIDLEFSVGYAF